MYNWHNIFSIIMDLLFGTVIGAIASQHSVPHSYTASALHTVLQDRTLVYHLATSAWQPQAAMQRLQLYVKRALIRFIVDYMTAAAFLRLEPQQLQLLSQSYTVTTTTCCNCMGTSYSKKMNQSNGRVNKKIQATNLKALLL